jgi:excisionase family DNA binding protein
MMSAPTAHAPALALPSAQPPIAVTPAEASRLLSTGITHVYDLLRAGELHGFHSGRARRITMASIHDYIARQLAAANSAGTLQQDAPPRRRRRSRERA